MGRIGASLQACWVGAAGSGELPSPAAWLELFTSAWRAVLALSDVVFLAGR
ncbi:hypothetical protein D3C77_647590 [compost metagenome]